MIKYKQTRKMVEEPEAVICDVCKVEFAADDLETQEFHHVRFTGGYGSIFGDGMHVECDICQYCLKRLIGTYCRMADPATQENRPSIRPPAPCPTRTPNKKPATPSTGC